MSDLKAKKFGYLYPVPQPPASFEDDAEKEFNSNTWKEYIEQYIDARAKQMYEKLRSLGGYNGFSTTDLKDYITKSLEEAKDEIYAKVDSVIQEKVASSTTEQAADIKSSVDAVKQENDALKTQISDAKGEIDSVKDSIDSIKTDNTIFKTQINENVNNQVSLIKSIVENQTSTMKSAVDNQIMSMKTSAESLQSQVSDKVSSEVTSLKSQNVDFRNEFAQKLNDYLNTTIKRIYDDLMSRFGTSGGKVGDTSSTTWEGWQQGYVNHGIVTDILIKDSNDSSKVYRLTIEDGAICIEEYDTSKLSEDETKEVDELEVDTFAFDKAVYNGKDLSVIIDELNSKISDLSARVKNLTTTTTTTTSSES